MAGHAETAPAESSDGGSGSRSPATKTAVAALAVFAALNGTPEPSEQPPEVRGSGVSVIAVGCVPGAEPSVVGLSEPSPVHAPIFVVGCLGKAGGIDYRLDGCPPDRLNGMDWFRLEIESPDFNLGQSGSPPSPVQIRPPDYLIRNLAWSIDSLSELSFGISPCASSAQAATTR